MSPRSILVAFAIPFAVPFTFLLLLLIAVTPLSATPARQSEPPDYQIVVTKTVGLDPSACSDTSAITVPFATDVYYCYTVTNTGSLTLTRHTLRDNYLGDHVFVAPLPPGASLNTMGQGLILSSTIFLTTTNIVTWTAEPNGYEEATASASATVNVPVIPSGEAILVTTFVDELNDNSQCSLREAVRAANLDQRVGACPAGDGADIILLPAGFYNLTIEGTDEEDARTGDLDILDDLTIQGIGKVTIAVGFLVRGDPYTIVEGIFQIFGTPPLLAASASTSAFATEIPPVVILRDLRLQGSILNSGTLTLLRIAYHTSRSAGILNSGALTFDQSSVTSSDRDPEFPQPPVFVNSGTALIVSSAISNTFGNPVAAIDNSGQLMLTTTTIHDNGHIHAGRPSTRIAGLNNAGVAMVADVQILNNEGMAIANSGTLTVTNTRMEDNTGLDAGGILNSGQLYVNDSQILDNSSIAVEEEFDTTLDAGGLLNLAGGSATVVDSQINGNFAWDSGGIENAGKLLLLRVQINDNHAARQGGIHNQGELKITQSQVHDNSSSPVIEWQPHTSKGGGLGNDAEATVTVTATSILHNTNLEGGEGAGVWNAGTLTVVNSAIASNTIQALSYEVEVIPAGGGLFNQGNATMLNSTISQNMIDVNPFVTISIGGGIANYGQLTLNNTTIYSNSSGANGGGIFNSSQVTISNSILNNNTLFGGTPSECEGTLTSGGYNLIGNLAGCTVAGDSSGNLTELDPQLGPLADNGGDTLTHALLWDSPAIDAGNPAAPGSGGFACETTDQRGLSRPQDGNDDSLARCDIGAYELCTDTSNPLCVAIPPAAPIDGTGGNVENPDAPHELHLPFLNLER